jgi:SOS-response transcriptional repressor LexA
MLKLAQPLADSEKYRVSYAMLDPREMELCLAVKAAVNSTRPKRSAEWLSKQMDVSVYRLRHIIQGNTAPEPAELDQIRAILKLPDNWPQESLRLDGARKGELVSMVGTPLRPIQIVGDAAAGPGVWNVDTDRRVVKVPSSIAELGTIAFIVDGDSMMPMLREFDTAVFRERRKLLQGFVFLVKLPDVGFVVKRAIYERHEWFLESLNRAYPRFPLPNDAEVIGLLVGYYRVRGNRETFEADADGLVPDELA